MARDILILGCLALVAVTYTQSFKLPSVEDPADNNRLAEDESTDNSPDELPGLNLSFAEQCRNHKPGYFFSACKTNNKADLCGQLKCASIRGDIPVAEDIGPALDGTWCEDGKMCLEGACVRPLSPILLLRPEKFNEGRTCTDSEDSDSNEVSLEIFGDN